MWDWLAKLTSEKNLVEETSSESVIIENFRLQDGSSKLNISNDSDNFKSDTKGPSLTQVKGGCYPLAVDDIVDLSFEDKE